MAPWLDVTGRIYTLEEALTSDKPEIRGKLAKELMEQEWHYTHDFRPESDCWKYGKEKVNPEPHEVWCATGSHGYWTLKTAQLVLRQTRKRDAKGMYNYTDHGCCCQQIRNEYRIVKVTYTPEVVEVLEENNAH